MVLILLRPSICSRFRFAAALFVSPLVLALATEAQAQTEGDCVGPPLPSQLGSFDKPTVRILAASAKLQQASEAQLPESQKVYLRLPIPLVRNVRAIPPIRFLKYGWRTNPVAGGFVSIRVRKPGTYWIASGERIAAIKLIPQKTTKPIDAERIFFIPCRIATVVQFKLKSGLFRMQLVVSDGSNTDIMFTAAGANDGSFVDIPPRKRTGR